MARFPRPDLTGMDLENMGRYGKLHRGGSPAVDIVTHGVVFHLDYEELDRHIKSLLANKERNMANGAQARRAALMGIPPSSAEVHISDTAWTPGQDHTDRGRVHEYHGPDDVIERTMSRAMGRVSRAVNNAHANVRSATMSGRNDLAGLHLEYEKLLVDVHGMMHSSLMEYRQYLETILNAPKSPEEISRDMMNVSTTEGGDMVITYKQNGSNYDVKCGERTITLSPHDLIRPISQVTEMNKLIPVQIIEG